jgi:4-amino-4-deoxy-L-arabinose transferase-like glycosyltransferase
MPALRPRSTRSDLIVLVALCAVVYALGLTAHGLTNWQEAQRALVAREMQAAGNWIVPLSAGKPYLSKPPLVYWCQLVIAKLVGGPITEFELRLTAAIAGLLGVVATYLVTRRLLGGPDEDEPTRAWADHAAWWASLMLATGLLYVRSARIGELDILLVAPTVVAVGAIHAAWRWHVAHDRLHWRAILVMLAMGMLCALAKGPPGILAYVLAGYGGVVMAELRVNRERGEGERRRWPVAIFKALSRTWLLLAVLVPIFALWLWARAVAAKIGSDAVMAAMEREAGENLRLLVLEAPLSNVGAAAYAVGVGSIAAIAGAVWLIKYRLRLPVGWLFVLAWIVLPLIAFSVLGKGVGRYLTPVWPAIAMLGGMWIATVVRDEAWGRWVARLAMAAVVALAVGQAAWYGYGREMLYADRSPRAFLHELLRPELGVDPDRLATLDTWTPAMDFYAGTAVGPIADLGPEIEHPSRKPASLERVAAYLKRTGDTMTILVRETPHPSTKQVTAIDRLHAVGLETEVIPVKASFVIDNRRTRMIAVRVRAR